MAHAQKPDFVFPWNRRVHLNRWGCQFSQLLAAEVCASAVVLMDTPQSEVAWEYWLPTPFHSPVSPSLPLPCATRFRTSSTTAFTAWASYNMQRDDFDMTNFNVIQDYAILSFYEPYSHSSVHAQLCGLPCCSCAAKPTWSFEQVKQLGEFNNYGWWGRFNSALEAMCWVNG
jgi:hypothetical protein